MLPPLLKEKTWFPTIRRSADAAVDEQKAVPEAGADSGASTSAEGLQKKLAVVEAQLESLSARERDGRYG